MSTGTCWDLARTAAAHHDGASGLHGDAGRAHELFQTSTMAALLDGVFDGTVTYGELARHGDFGLGTFNHLDGEMVALDGAFWHLHADGRATPVDPAERTPFACVTRFDGEALARVTEPTDRAGLVALLDALVPSTSLFYAVRVDGLFARVTTRTVARQEPPYVPLVEATVTQAVTTFGDRWGTLVGFRAPDYAQGLTVSGYHLHFIDQARRAGGHVLDCVLDHGTVLIDQESGFHLALPESGGPARPDRPGRDLAAEIRAAEGPT